jgi:hypothetical protein
MLERSVKAAIREVKNLLGKRATKQRDEDFDKDAVLFPRLNWIHRKLVAQAGGNQRPNYAWGVLQGASLAKNLSIPRVSVVEFGVAGGSGLAALEQVSTAVESIMGVNIDVYGFDAGTGLPAPVDYRDLPNLFSKGDFPMGVEKLRHRLRNAQILLGPVKDTVSQFVASRPAPVAFVAFDLDLYSSTERALTLFDAPSPVLLPRIHCYFDDIMGYTHNDFAGERLAIAEFNSMRQARKVSPIYGLRHFVSAEHAFDRWVESFYIAHIFDHDLYTHHDGLVRTHVMELK